MPAQKAGYQTRTRLPRRGRSGGVDGGGRPRGGTGRGTSQHRMYRRGGASALQEMTTNHDVHNAHTPALRSLPGTPTDNTEEGQLRGAAAGARALSHCLARSLALLSPSAVRPRHSDSRHHKYI